MGMKIYVLVAQRNQRYEGQYGFEALECMSEYEMDDNPEYMDEKRNEYLTSCEFESVALASLEVSEQALKQLLFPARRSIPAEVEGASEDPVAIIRALQAEVKTERQILYQSSALPDGSVQTPSDANEIERLDGLLDITDRFLAVHDKSTEPEQ